MGWIGRKPNPQDKQNALKSVGRSSQLNGAVSKN